MRASFRRSALAECCCCWLRNLVPEQRSEHVINVSFYFRIKKEEGEYRRSGHLISFNFPSHLLPTLLSLWHRAFWLLFRVSVRTLEREGGGGGGSGGGRSTDPGDFSANRKGNVVALSSPSLRRIINFHCGEAQGFKKAAQGWMGTSRKCRGVNK